MSSFFDLLLYTLTFLLLHNLVLVRGVGASLSVSVTRSYRYVLVFGACVTLSSTFLSMPAWCAARLLALIPGAAAFEPLFFGILICGLYIGVHYGLRWRIPEMYARYSNDVALAVLNCVVVTALALPFHERMGFGESVLFGFETGLSFLMGLLIVLEGQRRLATAKVPRAFRGLPVMLLYIGLIAMALYGFLGHQLPF